MRTCIVAVSVLCRKRVLLEHWSIRGSYRFTDWGNTRMANSIMPCVLSKERHSLKPLPATTGERLRGWILEKKGWRFAGCLISLWMFATSLIIPTTGASSIATSSQIILCLAPTERRSLSIGVWQNELMRKMWPVRMKKMLSARCGFGTRAPHFPGQSWAHQRT